jgi:hypothetical protein
MDPTYSELDFSEYLPNGGWGVTGNINYQTTWYTYQAEPWIADNQHSEQARSMNGWHDIMATVGGGSIRYYIDGQLVGTHGGKYYPRQNMSIDFNNWFIDLAGHSGAGTSVYRESVDYVYHAKKQTLTPAQAAAVISSYRAAGTTHTDSVVAGNDCDGGTSLPVTNPPTATRPPTTVPPTAVPPTTVPPTTVPPATAPPSGNAWAAFTAYSAGQVVTQNGASYRCLQTHTSLPGWEPANVLALWLPV